MKILVDSNVIIAAYPKPGELPEAASSAANALLSLANEHGHTIYYHPLAWQYDFGNIKDAADRDWRKQITANLPDLPEPPLIQQAITNTCGNPAKGSNDWVDHNLLAAAVGHAVAMLVTEDDKIHQKARRLGLGERVAYIEDAVAAIRAFAPRPAHPTLLPQQTLAHGLDVRDQIFESLRADYSGFDQWLEKCQEEHRICWTVQSEGSLAALTIVKDETPAEFGPGGKTLKVCLFKVSEHHPGMRYGELLLKSVFDYAYINGYDSAYLTVLPKQQLLISSLAKFGFTDDGERKGVELVLAKRLKPVAEMPELLDPLDYHIRYGTKCYETNAPRFIVPIEPRYHNVLFPETGPQHQMPVFGTLTPAGNSILKAYLSRGSIRQITPGAILYFYHSQDRRCIDVVGVAESTMVSRCQSEIASYVGKRTVYSPEQILEMTENGEREVLTILFRQARVLRPSVSFEQLKGAKVCQAPPQSIMQASASAAIWLKDNIDLKAQ